MKKTYKLSMILLLSHLVGIKFSFAQSESIPLLNTEIIVFDAICVEETKNKGYLIIELQAENEAASFSVSGRFHNHDKASANQNSNKRHLIPITKCIDMENELVSQAGRIIYLDGQMSKRAYSVYEDIWGRCRAHPHDGGGWYPCKTGKRKVTRYARKVLFKLGDLHILYKNK